MWKIDLPYVAESKKIVWEVAPFLRGRGIDVGAGAFKILPHAISVDNGIDNVLFGMQFQPDIKIETAEDLSLFASQSMDYVYSSHLLEHLENPERALAEFWRVLRVNHYLVLYLPHEDLYPKVGMKGANPDHRHNLNEQILIDWMSKLSAWDLEVCEQRNADDEYSFLMIFKKIDKQMKRDKHTFSYLDPKPSKTACVVRYGAFGDLLMASSVWAGLKKEGYHVTVFASPPGSSVIETDPNIDKLVLFDKDQVPNLDLGNFFNVQARKFTKFVNLCESVEGTFLALPGRTQHTWAPAARHKQMSYNYVQFAHELAGLPHDPQIHFYPTLEEKQWARTMREKLGGEMLIMWALAGSSVHKVWSGMDNIIASIMLKYPAAHVVLVGGPECVILEQGWEKEPRVHLMSGKWNIRQTLSLIEHCDLIIGPETGVLNAASCSDVAKICFLSHSTFENLTRDWKNTISIFSTNTSCPGRGNNEAPACHQMQYGWTHCRKHEESGTAQCQANIAPEGVWTQVDWALKQLSERKKKVA